MTSKRARDALAERIAASPEFAKGLQRPETMEVEDDDELDEDNPMDEVIYDEIDSSKMIDEETEALILQEPGHLDTDEPDAEPDHGDVHVVGDKVDRYTGYEFSSHEATNWWVEWDAMSHV